MDNLKVMYDDDGNIVNQYHDEPVRTEGSIALTMIEGIDCVSNKIDIYDEDVICFSYPNLRYELEHGTWSGNRWNINNKSSQRDIFNKGIGTINVQDRKWWMWNHFSPRRIDKNNKLNTIKTIHYVRMNKTYDQLCLVRDEVLRDRKNLLLADDKLVGNSTVVEDYFCIPENLVETYNKQLDGTWLLNGGYWGEEIKRNRIKELRNPK